MLANLLLLLLITVSCEAQPPKVVFKTNVYKRGISHSERAEFLHWHNYYRRQVENPRAANMTYLLYHKELETAAFEWAVKCDFKHGNFEFTRNQLDPKIDIGQNIFVRAGEYSVQHAVFRWFEEHSDYSFKDKNCKPLTKCGHYEQVAGAVVTHIGCAIVYCPKYINSKINKEAYNIVCNYYPSAITTNWYRNNENKLTHAKLKIYEEGEPCTACPDGYKVCEDKLCRSSPPCSTLDNECRNPVNTTTCLCDASVYPVYDDSGLSLPSSSVQSSPKQTTASVMKSLPSTITDLPLTKATESAVTAPITSTKTSSTVGSTASQSTRGQTTTRTEILQETTTEIFETISAETVKKISRTQSTSTETRTLEIYTSEITKQVTFTQTDDDTITALEITDEGNRQHEITTRPTSPDIATRPTSPDITTRPTSPDITTRPTSPHTSTIAAATSSGRFGPGDNMTTAYREPSVPEKIQPMCFIKMSTKYLTQDDMLPKDPGAIGDELFQRRWRQIQSQPKLSLQALQQQQRVVASKAAALPFLWLSVTMQCFHFMIAAVVCLIMWAFG